LLFTPAVAGSGPAPGSETAPAAVREFADPASWAAEREAAAVEYVDTVRFAPGGTFSHAPEGGHLEGDVTVIRHERRRFRAPNGRGVDERTLLIPVVPRPGIEDTELDAMSVELNKELGDHVNKRFELPDSGDQLHVIVKPVKVAL